MVKMEKENQNWDPESLSQEFLKKAEECQRYLDEIKTKLHMTKSYDPIFDLTLAELHVFNYLHRRSFLTSRHGLLVGLKSLLEFDVPKVPEVFDFERFKMVRRNIIENLIRRFERDV
jgi:hypothetical protein